MPLTFDERDRRHRRIRTMMEEKGLSVLVVASSAMWTGHVRYFSNYVASYGYIYLVFPKEGDPTQFVFTKAMAEVASRGWVGDSRQSSNPADAIIRRIKELGYGNERIGLVGAENMSFEFFGHLREGLPSANFINATREVFDLRMIKSAEEQSLARDSARIADRLFARLKEVARSGMRECDIYAEISAFGWKQGVESAFLPLASGRFPMALSVSPSDRVLGSEDCLLFELTPRFMGYYTQLTVVHSPQGPGPKMSRFLEVAFAARKAGLDALKPGNRAGDVAKAMKEVVEGAGYLFPFRGGHGLGHDLDEPPAIVPEDETVLSPGMTVVVHPSVMDKNGDGVFIGDSYLVTGAGCEPLNNAFNAVKSAR